jgi:Phage Terminase
MGKSGVVRSIDSFERFCGRLVLDNGRLMTLERFQRRMLEAFFDGTRETVTCIAKGSGKTTLLAALALYELLTDPGCEGAVCAASRDQGALLLGQLRGFVQRSPGLASRVRLKQRETLNRKTGGRFRVLAADTDTMDGLLLSFAVADELHRWRDSERYTILLAGVQKRQGRMLGISTAGIRGEGLLWGMRERALELGAERDGAYLSLLAPRFAWHELSLPDDANPRDLDAVLEANPAPWITRDLLEERFESPSMTDVDWRRFFANQWVDRAEVETVIPISAWLQLVDHNVQPLEPVVIAVDAAMDRSAAAVAVAALTDAAGQLPLVDVVEYGAGIAWTIDRVVGLAERWSTVGVVVDPGGPAASLVPRLEEMGLTVIPVSARNLAQASGLFYDAVINGTLRHRGAQPLTESVQGAARRPLAQAWAFDRRKALADPSSVMAAVLAHRGAFDARSDRPGRARPDGGIEMTISPWQPEDRKLTRPARRFLSQIRSGRTFDEAAARAGVSSGDVRTWLRSDDAFKAAYQQNLRNAGRPRIINPAELLAGGEERWIAAASDREQNIADHVRELSDHE